MHEKQMKNNSWTSKISVRWREDEMRKGVFIWRLWVGEGKRKTRLVRKETAEMEEAGIPSKTKENSFQMLHLLPRNKGRDTLWGSNVCARKKPVNTMC